jgi:CheY-like chemotaxis protein
MEAKKMKILIVEDEPAVREGLREWLTEDGYDVECVNTGEDALKRIREEEFGVIVLDLRLPGIDGLQVFEEAKGLTPQAKGILITAFPSKETLEKAKKLGILDYLPKPFQVTDLERVIHGALGELEEKKIDKKHLWLEVGALSYRICDRNYDCASCPVINEIQDSFGTVVLISDEEIKKLKQSPDSQKFCRYGSVHVVNKDRPRLA